MKDFLIHTLFSILLLNPLFAQNNYALKGSNLGFSTKEELIAVYDNPGFAVFKNSQIEVTLSVIRFLNLTGIENELIKRFPSEKFTITQKGKLFEQDNLKGLFYFASQKDHSSHFAKGIIMNDDRTILVEITYDDQKEERVKELIESFFSPSNSNSPTIAQATEIDDDDEYVQPFNYNHNYSQLKENVSSIVESNSQQQVPNYPRVTHSNLIVLSQSQKQEFIDAHNRWRADVGVPPLKWNNNLENYAAEWAVTNGKKNCKMVHRSKSDYGENLYWSSGMEFTPRGAVDSWGSEIEDYNDELVGQEKAVVGHYTQIVWRTTTEVGCAAFKCGKALLVVCNYNPPGNWVGQHPYK
jgi:uncharacterized protein YkwD